MPLTLGISDHVLRSQLAEITKPADAPELKEQIQQMAKLALTHPHSVTLHEENVPGSPRFSCYQYSFGIADVRVRDGPFEFFPGGDFAEILAQYQLEEIGVEDAEDGDHILYSREQIEHAGRVNSTTILSKWGTGHIWRHSIYEVPTNYGDTVHFYRHFPPQSVIQVLQDLGFRIL
jgi:hypothetical protein